MNYILSSCILNRLDTTSSPEGMRTFKPDIPCLGEAFLLATQQSFCQPCPWHCHPSITVQRLLWLCGTAGRLCCCSGKHGGVGAPSQPHPSQAAWINWVLVCMQIKHQTQTCTKRNSSMAAQQLSISRTGHDWSEHKPQQKSILCPLFSFW